MIFSYKLFLIFPLSVGVFISPRSPLTTPQSSDTPHTTVRFPYQNTWRHLIREPSHFSLPLWQAKHSDEKNNSPNSIFIPISSDFNHRVSNDPHHIIHDTYIAVYSTIPLMVSTVSHRLLSFLCDFDNLPKFPILSCGVYLSLFASFLSEFSLENSLELPIPGRSAYLQSERQHPQQEATMSKNL